jgi:hypothetical protein
LIAMKFRLLATILAMLANTSGARAQAQYPPETKNAALLYWAAFAEMQGSVWELMEKTSPDNTEWNETKFGPTLDANAQAIRTMQQATNLPECDWGPKDFGMYLLQARALAGLNTLEGIRQMAKGDSQTAVNTWLAGIHFSQDVTRGKPVINVLFAKHCCCLTCECLPRKARRDN